MARAMRTAATPHVPSLRIGAARRESRERCNGSESKKRFPIRSREDSICTATDHASQGNADVRESRLSLQRLFDLREMVCIVVGNAIELRFQCTDASFT